MSGSGEGRRVALVLGAAVWPGGRPSPSLARRAGHAAGLWHAGRVEVILGCGGVGRHPPSEAEVIVRLCRDAGVPEAALLREDASTTTRENLRNARPILRRIGADAVVIVTDPYHAPRARLIARQEGLAVTSSSPRWSDLGWRQWLRHIPREALALLAVVLRLR